MMATVDDLINNAEVIIQAQLKEYRGRLIRRYLEQGLDPISDLNVKTNIDNEVKKVKDDLINKLTDAETKAKDQGRKVKIQALKQKLKT